MTDTIDNKDWSEPFTGPEMKALCLPGDVEVRDRGGFVYPFKAWKFTNPERDYTLPADHPAVTVALHNRKHGASFAYRPEGSEPPEDWDGGLVLMANGHTFIPAHWHWANDVDRGEWDERLLIIGYHKRTEQPAEVVGEPVPPPPGWAHDKIVRLLAEEPRNDLRNAFARYIGQHEEAPPPLIDPDLLEARQIAASRYGFPPGRCPYLAGKNDDMPAVSIALAAIRRGRELAQAQP